MENEGPPRVSLGSGSEADEKNREHPDKSRNSSYGKTPSPPVDVNKSLIDLTIEDDKIPMRSEGLNEISTSEKEEQERTPKGGENAKNEMNGDGDGTRKTMKRPMEEGEATPSCPTHVSTGIEFKSKRTRTSDTECEYQQYNAGLRVDSISKFCDNTKKTTAFIKIKIIDCVIILHWKISVSEILLYDKIYKYVEWEGVRGLRESCFFFKLKKKHRYFLILVDQALPYPEGMRVSVCALTCPR